jgi:hypothetical protein
VLLALKMRKYPKISNTLEAGKGKKIDSFLESGRGHSTGDTLIWGQ